jgi:hypothetical protein
MARRARKSDESTRALLVRFCRWAQAHPDLTDGEEAFVDQFMTETAPTFGRAAGMPLPAPEPAPEATPRPAAAAAAAAAAASGERVGWGSLLGAVIDRVLKD